MTFAPYAGRYINLDRSEGRRRLIEAQLAALGLTDRYQRLAGVDGRDLPPGESGGGAGERGCYLSHLRAIESAAGEPGWLHVLEDDAEIGPHWAMLVNAVTTSAQLAQFDIILTNARMLVDLHKHAELRALFDRNVETGGAGEVAAVKAIAVLPLGAIDFYLTTSYFVNPRSRERTAALLADSLKTKPFAPVDNTLSALSRAGALSIACTLPFFTSTLWDEASTISATLGPWSIGHRIMETALFTGRDMTLMRRRLKALDAQSPASATSDLIGAGYRYLMRAL